LKPEDLMDALILACLALWAIGGVKGCALPVVFTKADAATYVYEKDQTAIPSPVLAALDKLNRRGVRATTFDDDTVDGAGQTPDQYKAPLKAATEAGLPALVVTAGEQVLRTVKDPRTEAAVLEAVP
jgi:hypothetical protein